MQDPSWQPSFHTQSGHLHQKLVDTQRVIYPLSFLLPGALPVSGGHHSDRIEVDLCSVHMWLSVRTPQTKSKGPALCSRQPAPNTG